MVAVRVEPHAWPCSALYFYPAGAFILLGHPTLFLIITKLLEDTMRIPDRITCRPASLFCLVLLSMFMPAAALAQTAAPRFESGTLSTPAHDVAIAGTVQQVITTHIPGEPIGIQLVAEGPQGSFTASLGSALSNQVRQTLQPGTAVQVSGIAATINGKNYLLARKLTVDGNQIIIRNQHGFLLHNSVSRGAK